MRKRRVSWIWVKFWPQLHSELEVDKLLETCSGNVRDKLLYEFGKIADRIVALKKKHS